MPRVSSRNGKELPNYDLSKMDFDLSEPDEDYPMEPESKDGESNL